MLLYEFGCLPDAQTVAICLMEITIVLDSPDIDKYLRL